MANSAGWSLKLSRGLISRDQLLQRIWGTTPPAIDLTKVGGVVVGLIDRRLHLLGLPDKFAFEWPEGDTFQDAKQRHRDDLLVGTALGDRPDMPLSDQFTAGLDVSGVDLAYLWELPFALRIAAAA